MDKMEQILDRVARKRMIEWELNNFKQTHSYLFNTIIEAMNEASKNLAQPDVIKSVCQKCGDEMEGATYNGYKMCHICREWQTVL